MLGNVLDVILYVICEFLKGGEKEINEVINGNMCGKIDRNKIY